MWRAYETDDIAWLVHDQREVSYDVAPKTLMSRAVGSVTAVKRPLKATRSGPSRVSQMVASTSTELTLPPTPATGWYGGNHCARSSSRTLALSTVTSAPVSTRNMHETSVPWMDATSPRMIGRVTPSGQRYQLPSIRIDPQGAFGRNLIDEPAVVVGVRDPGECERLERRLSSEDISF
jgi:hypothetical protein